MNSSSSSRRRTTWDVSQRSSASSSTMRDNRQRRRTSAPATTINIHQYQPSNTMMETVSSSSDDDSNNSSYIRTDVSFISSNISIDTELAENLFPVANRDSLSPQQLYTYSHSDRSGQESRGGSKDGVMSTTSSSVAGASLQHDLPKHWTNYNETTITENTLQVPNLGTCNEILDEDYTDGDVEAYDLPSNRINRIGATSTTSGSNPLSESEQAYRALMSLMSNVATDGCSSNSDKGSINNNTNIQHEQRGGGRLTCNTRRKSNAARMERRLSNQSSSSFCRYGPPDNRAGKSTDTLDDIDSSTSTASTTTQRRSCMKKCIRITLITLVVFVIVSALVVYLVIENQEYGNTETENKGKDSLSQSTTTILEVLSNVFVERFSSNDGTKNTSREGGGGGDVRDLYFENDSGWNDDEYREERVSLLFQNITR